MPTAPSTKHLALPPDDIAAGLPVVIDDGSQYVHGAGLEEMVAGGNTYYYLADGLGSTMAIVNSTGAVQKSYTYDVYGKPTATGSLANEFDFAGQQTDPTGLQYLRARYDDSEVGRFVSRDPLASVPGWLGQPFAYANGSPATLSDAAGLFCPGCDTFVKGGKAVGGAVKDGAEATWDAGKAVGGAVVDYGGDKAKDTRDTVTDTWNHPSSAIQNSAGLAVSFLTVGDRHDGPGGFYWYDNASGLGAFIPDKFGQTAITIGNGSFSNDPMEFGSELWWHEFTHYEQSTEHGWRWLYDYFKGGPHDTNPFENEARSRGARCAGSMSCPEKP